MVATTQKPGLKAMSEWKLYTASVTVDVVILARNDDEADSAAFSALQDEISNSLHSADIDIGEMTSRRFPDGWKAGCYVYGTHPNDVRIEDAFDLVGLLKPKTHGFAQGD